MIRNNAKRIDRIVGEVLQLNRRDRQQPEVIRLGDFMRSLTDEIVAGGRHAAPAASCIDISNDLLVMFDRGHLNQIAWNLVRNAWQHCQKQEGSIRIAARAGYMGDAVICELDDDGPGMPAEFRAQIFEPFFTTRSGRHRTRPVHRARARRRQRRGARAAAQVAGRHFRLTFKRALTPAATAARTGLESRSLRIHLDSSLNVPQNPWSTQGAGRR